MFIKIATIVAIVALALGGGGIAVVAAQANIPDGGTAVKAETQTKNAGVETQLSNQFMVQTMAQTMTQTMAQTMTMLKNAFAGYQNQNAFQNAFQFGTQEEFVPGNPWTEVIEGAGNGSGFGFGFSAGEEVVKGAGQK